MALTLFEDTFLLDASPFLFDSDWEAATLAEKEKALKQATSLLDSNSWISSAASASQTLSWPRKTFDYFDASFGLYTTVEEGDVPRSLQKATALLALHLVKYPQATSSFNQTFDSITVGPISLTNSNASSDPGRVPAIPSTVIQLLSPFLASDSALKTSTWWRAN